MNPGNERGDVSPRFLLLALTALCATVRAQYAIERYSLNGGGGTSTGSGYSVTGTIGQADAGAMSGGLFALEGGFWPGLALPILGGPTLFIQLAASQVTLSWSPATPGFGLEATDDLAAPVWTAVPGGASSPTTLAIGTTTRFFRLVNR